jgi:hypothetical protein
MQVQGARSPAAIAAIANISSIGLSFLGRKRIYTV